MLAGIEGHLTDYSESGTEGLIWCIHENDKEGYDALHAIEEGDFLIIYENDGGTIFTGYIKKDTEIGRIPHPSYPSTEQQAALGYWIHWVQDGWQPDEWAILFIKFKCRAVLFKKVKR